MKSLLLFALLTVSALLSSCAFHQRNLVLDPVGPSPVPSTTVGDQGALVVYSAFDVHADFSSTDPDRRKYTDYKILSGDGKLLRVVHNDTGTLLERPVEVDLPAGNYRVLARANGYGEASVPVIIAANRVTAVHLEGDGSWSKLAAINPTNAVCLPDGQFVGWRANSPKTAQTVNQPSSVTRFGNLN